uniref:hypothetical protein n=1 Tax=Hypnea nidifica TaxID=673448 RepID=UPI0027DAAEB5|nr:hypothetical protein REP52_pgp122 [Hypnea nidifica]WCH54315.1 hypothetical protein [Hypnea nidifica]
MTKRTVNNIYIKYEFSSTNIYHTLKKINVILIIFFSIFFIFIYKNHIKQGSNYNKKLAFQVYIINFNHKIQIDDPNIKNEKIFLKILPKYQNKIKKYKSKINIEKILEYLKSTGIINRLNYFIININNLKYYIVQFRINRIIKKIEIQNYQNLQIASKLILDILKHQLGTPISYFKVHNITNKIYTWYINNGFSHTYIKLKYNNKLRSLHIQIFEGKVIANLLICKSKNMLSSNMIKKINTIVIKELGISEQSIFNKKKIDRGIIYLKKIQLLKKCSYKVKKHKQGLLLKVEYSIPINHYGYIYHHTSNNIMHNLLLYHFLNHDYSILLPIHFYTSTKTLQKFIKEITQINKFYSIYLKYKNNFNKTFNSNYIKFNYYLHYMNSSYKINFQTINNNPEFEFSILIPYIKIHKILLNFIKFNLYQKIYNAQKIYPKQKNIIKNIIIKNKIVSNINIKSQSNFITINQKVFKNFNYKFKYSNIYNLLIEKFLHLKINNLKQFIIQTQKIKKNTKILKQKIIFINTYIKYSNLKCKKFLEPGKTLILELFFLKPKAIMKKNTLYRNKSNIHIKFKYYQIISLPNYLKVIKKNAFNIYINVNSLILNNHYVNILDDINHKSLQIYFQKRYQRIIKNTLKNLYQIEYHISLNKFFSYYIFSYFNNKLYNKNKISKYNYVIGLGIQVNIPIKTLPKIRFEYKINKYDINHYQLRLFSSCTNNH